MSHIYTDTHQVTHTETHIKSHTHRDTHQVTHTHTHTHQVHTHTGTHIKLHTHRDTHQATYTQRHTSSYIVHTHRDTHEVTYIHISKCTCNILTQVCSSCSSTAANTCVFPPLTDTLNVNSSLLSSDGRLIRSTVQCCKV